MTVLNQKSIFWPATPDENMFPDPLYLMLILKQTKKLNSWLQLELFNINFLNMILFFNECQSTCHIWSLRSYFGLVFISKRFEGSFKIVGQTRKIRLFCKEILAFLDFQALESLHKKLIEWLKLDLGGGIKSPAWPYVQCHNMCPCSFCSSFLFAYLTNIAE